MKEKEAKQNSKPFKMDNENGKNRNGILTWNGKVLGLGNPKTGEIKLDGISARE